MAPGGRFTFNILLSPTAGSSQVCCLSAGVSAVLSVQERGLCDASGLCTLSPRRLQAVLLHRAGYLPGVFSEKRGNHLFCWDTCLLPPDLFRDSLSTFALTPLPPRLSTKPTPPPPHPESLLQLTGQTLYWFVCRQIALPSWRAFLPSIIMVETPCFESFIFVLDWQRQVFWIKKRNKSFLNFQRLLWLSDWPLL